MTVTEASRDASPEVAATPTPSAPPSGLAALVGSGDPRTIGKLFVGTSLLFLIGAVVFGALVGFEQADVAGSEIFGADTTQRMVSLFAVGALLLGVLPLLIGLATAIVPLQVGASTVAFPRASAAAYWVWLASGGILCATYAFDGGPWGTSEEATSMFVLALIVVAIALFVATASVVTTVLTLRAPGLTLRRTPLFSWSVLVGGTGWLLTLPVLAGLLLITYVDLRYGQQLMGGSSGIYNRIAWLFWQPTLYLVAVPALGIVADVVPVFAQRRHQKHGAAMVLLGLAAALGVGAWAQTGVSFDGGVTAPWLQDGVWNVVSFLAVVPILGLFGLWNLTMLKGKVRIGTPLILAQLGALAVLIGVGAGVATAIEGLDLDGTTFMTAQAVLVLGGALLGGLAGVAFWAPKLYGRLLPDAVVRLGATVIFLGGLVSAVGFAIGGAFGQLRFAASTGEGGEIPGVSSGDLDTVEVMNLVAGIGLAVVVAGLVLTVLAMLKRSSGDGPGDDPWSGHTLEWATSSPPPVGNFATVPEITSEAPVYDARHAAAGTTEASA